MITAKIYDFGSLIFDRLTSILAKISNKIYSLFSFVAFRDAAEKERKIFFQHFPKITVAVVQSKRLLSVTEWLTGSISTM